MTAAATLASLRPALLARKGTARPAMRGADTDISGLAMFDWSAAGDMPLPAQKPITPNRRAAFTLRLDKQRHRKLRLASAMQQCSAQKLVIEALDRFFDNVPQLEVLAAQAGQRPSEIS